MSEQVFIDKIIKSRIPGSCVLILSNGENVFSPIDAVMNLGLNKSSAITTEDISKIKEFYKMQKLYSTSMRLATGFIRSEFQIRQKLKQKEYNENQINLAIDKLKNLNLIDDSKFAENFINYSVSKKWGSFKLKYELSKRGINPDEYLELLNNLLPNENQLVSATELANRKLKLISNKPIQKQKESIYRHLISKGFNNGIIKDVLKEIF